ncbi:MAG: hypothetical protein ACO2PN_08490 [Pyrobaculum sp.]|jgi:hypothetical protein
MKIRATFSSVHNFLQAAFPPPWSPRYPQPEVISALPMFPVPDYVYHMAYFVEAFARAQETTIFQRRLHRLDEVYTQVQLSLMKIREKVDPFCNQLANMELEIGDKRVTYQDFTEFQLLVLAWLIEDIARSILITNYPSDVAKTCFYKSIQKNEERCLIHGYFIYIILEMLYALSPIGRRTLALLALNYIGVTDETLRQIAMLRNNFEKIFSFWLYAPLHQILSGLALARTDIYYHLEHSITAYLLRRKVPRIEEPAMTHRRPGGQYQVAITTLGRLVFRYMRHVIKDRRYYEADIEKAVLNDVLNLSRIYCVYNKILYEISEKTSSDFNETLKMKLDLCSASKTLQDALSNAVIRLNNIDDDIKRELQNETVRLTHAILMDLKNFLGAMIYPQKYKIPADNKDIISLYTNWRYLICDD